MMWVRRLSALALVGFAACEQDRGAVEIRPAGSSTQEIQGGTFDGNSTNVVAILLMDGQNVGICSGSLIAPNLVLTAHHCVAPSNTTQCGSSGFGATFAASSFRITTSGTAAETTLNQGQWPNVNNSVWFGASVVSVPPTPANNICGGDMALIRLTSNITNICPLIPRVDSAVVANEAYTAVGFGITSPTGQTSGTRNTVSGLNVLCENNCGAGTNGTLEWIGGTTAQRGVCEGDSGGPALDSLRRVIGTVSRGDANSCNQALYESVFGQGAWIKSIAAQAATAGGYTAAGWVSGGTTSINGCTGVDGGTGGGAGGGGGATGGGAGGGGGVTGGGAGGGGGTGTCNAGTMCVDATGQGDFACLSGSGGVPPGAPSCGPSTGCASGFTCWQTGTSTYACLQDCAGTPVGGGAGGGGGVTGGGAGGGGGSTGGACTNPSTTCVDASGMSNFACIDTNSSSGVPAGAPSCSQTMACPTNYGCWGTANGNFCLQNCTPGATGGGAGGGGGPLGGGAGGGVPVGGGAGGGVPVGGGAGGGTPIGGGAGGAGGGAPVGGGTGGAGGSGGSGGAAGGGTAGTGGGFNFPPLPDKPKPTGCGCAGVPDGASLWMMLSGLTLLRLRRRR